MKEYKPDKKIVFTNYKNMQIYCKKYTSNPFPKKKVVISKNKIKAKSKCVSCLTKRTFTPEIEDKYGLESELEIYLQFFTD